MKYSTPTELKHTVDDMLSDDYKVRFLAEYWQTKIRYEKLKDFCNKIEAFEVHGCGHPVAHDVPLSLLREQQAVMGQYLHMLEVRAVIEGISWADRIKSNDGPDIQKVVWRKEKNNVICDCYTSDGKCLGMKEIDPVSCNGTKNNCVYAQREYGIGNNA